MKTLGRIVVAGLLLFAVLILLAWREPIWLARQITHFGLLTARVQSNYVMTPEGRVHYYEAESRVPGGGIPIVLVHGLADRSESWAPMLKRLRHAGFHVYAPDLLGYGRSPKPADSDYSMATEEQFVVDFIQALGLQKTDLGGWSMGGLISMKVALDHPEMIDRLVVYDGVGVREGQPVFPSTLFSPQTVDDVHHLFALMEPENKPLPANIAKNIVRAMQDNQTTIAGNMRSLTGGQVELDGRMGSLQVPLLLVWGSEDKLTPLAVGQTFHRLAPNSELDVVEGCGHLAPGLCTHAVAQSTVAFLRAKTAPVGEKQLAK